MLQFEKQEKRFTVDLDRVSDKEKENCFFFFTVKAHQTIVQPNWFFHEARQTASLSESTHTQPKNVTQKKTMQNSQI